MKPIQQVARPKLSTSFSSYEGSRELRRLADIAEKAYKSSPHGSESGWEDAIKAVLEAFVQGDQRAMSDLAKRLRLLVAHDQSDHEVECTYIEAANALDAQAVRITELCLRIDPDRE